MRVWALANSAVPCASKPFVNQIRAGIVASGVVTSDSITRLMKIQNQTRDFRLLSISANAVADQVNVSAD